MISSTLIIKYKANKLCCNQLRKRFIIRFFLIFFLLNLGTYKVSAAFAQDPTVKQIDLLLKEADDMKFMNDSIGMSKVKEAEQLATLLENDRKLGEVYTMLGVFYYIQGKYDLSLEMYFKAISIHENHKNYSYLARSLNGVGLIQSGFNQLEESIVTFENV